MKIGSLCLALLTAILSCACSVAPKYTPEPATALIEPTGSIPVTVTSPLSEFKQANQGIGVALAGGGTKAASYAMGVLAGISDEHMFDKVDAISTVSGGGYAAFYLYSKVLNRQNDPTPVKPALSDFFADCIPHVYKKHMPETRLHRLCSPALNDNSMEKYRFQQFVRCRQDVLENDCNQELDGTDHSEFANAAGLLASTIMMIGPNFVARTLFDWPVNMSPSRYAYLEGIGTAYGLYPTTANAASNSRDLLDSCDKGFFLNCDADSGRALLNRQNLRFDNLASYLKNPSAEKMPTWIINATASRSRSIFGWATEGKRDFSQYTLQISPFTARSGFHGRIDNYRDHLDLLEATTAAAAFFDANETSVVQPGRLAGALSLHLAALDWGVDIPNPNVDSGWRIMHGLLPLWPWPWTRSAPIPYFPFPTYFADGGLRHLGGARDNQQSAYIRLLDGGNNDDLGAYTLIEARKRHIVISDHAQDAKGDMQDVCRLHNEVRLRLNGDKKLVVPGLDGFAEHCLQFVRESECGDAACSTVPGLENMSPTKGSYPITKWKHPVLLGCIRDRLGENSEDNCSGTIDTRIYILKPAIDLGAFVKQFLPNGSVDAKACPEELDAKASSRPGDPPDPNGEDIGVCEVAAYISQHDKDERGVPVLGSFPQHSTVGMTFASTGREYGAYRELARWQARIALRWTQQSDEDFAKAVSSQRGNHTERTLVAN